MSVEPTCDFCGASDKNRCRTQGQADGCDQNTRRKLTSELHPDRPLPRAERGALPKMALTKSLSTGHVSIETHQSGVIDRLTVSIERDQRSSATFVLQPHDVDILIDLLTKAKNYSLKGTL